MLPEEKVIPATKGGPAFDENSGWLELKGRPAFVMHELDAPQLPVLAEMFADAGFGLYEAQDLISRHLIEFALTKCESNQGRAAAMLGMHRNTLARWMAHLEIPAPRHWGKAFRQALVRGSGQGAGAPVARANALTPALQQNMVRKGGRGESPEPLAGGGAGTQTHQLERRRPVNVQGEAEILAVARGGEK